MQPKTKMKRLQPDATRIKNCVIIQKESPPFRGGLSFSLSRKPGIEPIKCGVDERRRRRLDGAEP